MVANDYDNGEHLEVAYQHLHTTPGRDDYKLIFKCIDDSETFSRTFREAKSKDGFEAEMMRIDNYRWRYKCSKRIKSYLFNHKCEFYVEIIHFNGGKNKKSSYK